MCGPFPDIVLIDGVEWQLHHGDPFPADVPHKSNPWATKRGGRFARFELVGDHLFLTKAENHDPETLPIKLAFTGELWLKSADLTRFGWVHFFEGKLWNLRVRIFDLTRDYQLSIDFSS